MFDRRILTHLTHRIQQLLLPPKLQDPDALRQHRRFETGESRRRQGDARALPAPTGGYHPLGRQVAWTSLDLGHATANPPPASSCSSGDTMQVSGGDIITKQKFDGKFKLHVEFRVPYMPKASGQGRGNSGVYLQGRYEVQVLDSYGLKSQNNDCGGIYTVAAPLVNACKAPTVWQTYDIVYQAPTCEAGKVTAPGVVTVHQNGVLIHDKQRLVNKKDGKEVIVTNTTAGMGGDVCTPGPILLQDHGNPVQYRNIWLVRE